MSRAFIDEDSEHQDELPDIPQSHFPGYITPEGFARLQKELDDLRDRELPPLLAELEEGGPSATEAEITIARIEQRVRYLNARLERAIVLDPATSTHDHVHFGAFVTTRDQNGHEMRVQIVGEDETDPDGGKVSWVSPLAKALVNKKIGEKAVWHRPIGDLELEIVKIEQTLS
jgi:transcription elongation factor GreB